MEEKRNKYGLLDAPVRIQEKETISLSPEEIEEQIQSGAFILPHDEAIALGLLSPYDEQDSVMISILENAHEPK